MTASESSPTADVYAGDTSRLSSADTANRGIHRLHERPKARLPMTWMPCRFWPTATTPARVAELVLQTVTNNKRRHDEIRRFMLATGSVTVAVEVPIYLTTDELAEFKGLPGLNIPLESNVTLTGHIEFLQIRNGAIHIVDYKPGAKSEKPIPQLMTYALALSRRTGLRLFHFVCSWSIKITTINFFRCTSCTSANSRPMARSLPL